MIVGVQHLWPLLGPETWNSSEIGALRTEIDTRRREIQQQYASLLGA